MRWLILALLTAAATFLLELLDVDAAALFAGLVVGAGLAIAGWAPSRAAKPNAAREATVGTTDEATDKAADEADVDPPIVPRTAMLAAQGTLGVSIGTMADPDTLAGLGPTWLPVLAVGLATLLLSVIGGALLGLHRNVDPLTGALALVAGGASGLVALTRELGGDERMVAVIQYLRVALVTISIPVVAALFASQGATNGSDSPAIHLAANEATGILLVAACLVIGLPLAKLIRLPAAGLLGPMIVATVAELTGIAGDAAVPVVLLTVAYMVIGWQAGLGFTAQRLRAVGRVVPYALVLIIAIGIGCAGLAALLSWWTGESMFDSYLATTPGGIYAVLAAATAAGTNVAFVVAAQIVRVLLMLFAAPLAARAAARWL